MIHVFLVTVFFFFAGSHLQLGATQVLRPVPKRISERPLDTALSYAIYKGYVTEVAALLSKGADVNFVQQVKLQGEPLLEVVRAIAAQNITTPVEVGLVKSLHDAGRYEATVKAYQEILVQLKKHPGVVRAVIKEAISGVPARQEEQQQGHSAEDIIASITQSYLMKDPAKEERLIRLISEPNVDHAKKLKIKQLIEEGADPNGRLQTGETLLMLALKRNDYELASFLIDAGADVAAVDSHNKTPFSYLFDSDSQGTYDKHARMRTRADFENPEKKRVVTILFGGKKEGVAERNVLKKFADASPEQYQFLERMRLIKRFILHGFKVRDTAQSPLWVAVNHGDYYAVKALLTSQPRDVPQGITEALQLALSHDDPLLVNELMMTQSQEDVSSLDKWRLRDNAEIHHAEETLNFFKSLDTQLLEAAERGDHQQVVMLLHQGAYPDVQDQLGTTAVMHAAQRGYLPILQELIHYGADLDERNNDGATALIIATLNNKPDAVAKLIEYDAQFDVQDNNGKTFSDYANLYPETSPLRETIDRASALMLFDFFVAQGKVARVQKLLKLYPSFINADLKGESPLIVALVNGKQEMVKFLLAQGADPRSWSDSGSQALAIAIRSKQLESITALLTAGAYIDVPEDDGTTLQQLVTTLNDPAITKLFESYVAWREQVLKTFAGRSKNNVTQTLQQGPRLTMISDGDGNTLLMLALKRKYMKLAEFLLGHGALINRGNKQGVTPLMQAAGRGVEHVIRFILEHGAAIDQQDSQGWSALTHALANNQIAAAQLLLIRGASLKLLDREGQTLLQIFHDNPELLAVVQGVFQKQTAAERHAQEAKETARLVALHNKIELDIAMNIPAENEFGRKVKRQKRE